MMRATFDKARQALLTNMETGEPLDALETALLFHRIAIALAVIMAILVLVLGLGR